ncbi:Deoxyribodipyrimidine photo-lyase [Taenia solium]|eukprot:TsM_000705500 transcript=TsM_000705500 gene=TsM_000705500
MMFSKPITEDFTKWLDRIDANRVNNCGKSVADYPFAACRVRRIIGKSEFKSIIEKNMDDICEGLGSQEGCVVYWMNRDQRIQDNWALLFAQWIALKFLVPLHVCFNLASSPALRTRRHANFLLEGLVEVEKVSIRLNTFWVVFHLLKVQSSIFLKSLLHQINLLVGLTRAKVIHRSKCR